MPIRTIATAAVWLCLGAAALAATPSAAVAQSLTGLAATEVAAMIDATSFGNSIGPRRREGMRTFADYGFTEVELNGTTAELYETDRSWMFGITVLSSGEDRVVVCVLDRALNGGSYHTQNAIAFGRGEDGLLVARDEDVVDPACPHSGE